jgi:UDP-N-acetylmuramoylalanine--D-glutamate ligase
MSSLNEIQTSSFAVIGAARSGLAAARLLHKLGARVFLSESAGREKCAEVADELDALGIPNEFGSHSDRVFEADHMVVSPGVPSDAPIIVRAQERGIEVMSEVELGSRVHEGPIIAVTGTNGKTTTTTLIGAVLQSAGCDPLVAGNIGIAFCEVLTESALKSRTAVLEISSFQLDHCVTFHPRIALLTTLTPDHLYRYHGRMEEYVASKQRIFMNQDASDVLLYNADMDSTVRAVKSAQSLAFGFSVTRSLPIGGWKDGDELVLNIGQGRETVCGVQELRISGAHNHMNVLSAALAARLHGVEMDQVRAAVLEFSGVEHRLELVRTLDGVQWINDSKATNVDSVITALQSCEQPVVLIAGGRDKQSPYDPLFELISQKVRTAVLIGEAADKMEQVFSPFTRIVRAGDMEEAVNIARTLAQPGDAVLLSPACSSFDMFTDFEERGRVFKELVRKLTGGETGS